MVLAVARSILAKQQINACRLVCISSVNNKVFYSSYARLTKEESPDYTRYHEVSSEHWKFVERLRAPTIIPSYPKVENYVSGWTPPPEKSNNLPYFVKRTKNFMVPVYLTLEAIRNQRKITMIKHCEGDIWALEKAVKAHLEELRKRPIVSQVHEVAMYIKFRGDYVLEVKDWLLKAGF